jgi:hypothetical protein
LLWVLAASLKGLVMAQLLALGSLVLGQPEVAASFQAAWDSLADSPEAADIPAGNLAEGSLGDNPAASACRAASDSPADIPSAAAQDTPSAADIPEGNLGESLAALACQAASDIQVDKLSAESQPPQAMVRKKVLVG